jgi:hypothetical protein
MQQQLAMCLAPQRQQQLLQQLAVASAGQSALRRHSQQLQQRLRQLSLALLRLLQLQQQQQQV